MATKKKESIKKTAKVEASIDTALVQTTKAYGIATGATVKTQEDYDKAGEILSKIKTVQKFVKQESDKIIEPLREAKRQAQKAMDAEGERWEKILNMAAEAEKMVKSKMIEFIDRVEAERLAKEKKIQDDLASGKIKKESTAVRKMDELDLAPKSSNNAQVKKIRVVQVADESKIPRAYWTLDMVKVRRDALAGVEIPGVEIKLVNDIAGLSK